MAIAATVIGIIKGHQGAKTTRTTLRWFAEAEHPTTTSKDVAEAINAQVITGLLAFLTEDYVIDEVEAWYSDFTIGAKSTWIHVVGEAGGITGADSMPLNVTANVKKIVDNTTILPIGADPFRDGYFGISGLTEGEQDAGLVFPGSQAVIQAWADDILDLQVTDGTTAQTYRMGLYRHSDIVANRAYVKCQSLEVSQRLGTRNSRKR